MHSGISSSSTLHNDSIDAKQSGDGIFKVALNCSAVWLHSPAREIFSVVCDFAANANEPLRCVSNEGLIR
jgi:hypothetical protein